MEDADQVRSILNAPKQHENDNDKQNSAYETDTTMAVTVAVATEAATEATEQKNDQNDDQYESERHKLSPLVKLKRNCGDAGGLSDLLAQTLCNARSWSSR